jgi:hypothetical protein
MRDVFGSRNWIFWWAALTSTVFLNQWLPIIANFFQDSGFFSPQNFPFSLVAGLNAWVDTLAEGIREGVQFDPSAPAIATPLFTIPMWVVALLFGILVLAGAVGLYVRALRSQSLGDDILTLLLLYFVLRIEAYVVTFANVGPLQTPGDILIDNPLAGFWILMFFLFLLVFMGGGLRSRQAFWRGLLEAVLLALFVIPTQTADLLSAFFAGLFAFSNLLLSNTVFAIAWGVLGAVMALTRLTSVSAPG